VYLIRYQLKVGTTHRHISKLGHALPPNCASFCIILCLHFKPAHSSLHTPQPRQTETLQSVGTPPPCSARTVQTVSTAATRIAAIYRSQYHKKKTSDLSEIGHFFARSTCCEMSRPVNGSLQGQVLRERKASMSGEMTQMLFDLKIGTHKSTKQYVT
jgi:hypothetical protein